MLQSTKSFRTPTLAQKIKVSKRYKKNNLNSERKETVLRRSTMTQFLFIFQFFSNVSSPLRQLLYKLYVRPHLDYGDVIYHIPEKLCEFSQNIILPNLIENFESVQYSAALAVSGTWRGTSRENLYRELGWESLSSRRWCRRLTLLYKFVNNLSPEYTVEPIPPPHQSHYCLRNQDVIGRLNTRTEKFKSTFYPNCLSEWNKLEPELRLAPSIAVFKKKLLSIIHPPLQNQFMEFTIQKGCPILLDLELVSAS